ncbi:BspA family leucine-rich repeat surface protein [Sediminicola sp. 1XM1-17]|uniref:BspA family leucine-rich repeat surface protein n=1 Tax=Sediminicola sp. 1XM1-17 TaxID=3127702 RepID=UPI0030789E53
MKKKYLSMLLGLSVFMVSAQTEFITTWKTDNTGVSNDNQIIIPTFPGEVYNYDVDWGDGSIDSDVKGDISHTYTTSGTYQIAITGDFPRIYFDFDGLNSVSNDREKILAINQWGNIQWSSMEFAFQGCSNLDVIATDTPDLSNVKSTFGMFYLCPSLVGNSAFSNWDVSNVSDFSSMFRGATLFNQEIGNWDMSNASSLVCLFCQAESFNQPIGNWNVSKVTNLNHTFDGAFSFNQDISNWDVSKVTSMGSTFSDATLFNQDLSSWDVGQVTQMPGMFLRATNFNSDISNWNVGKVTNMSQMFYFANAFNQPIGVWDTSNVTEMFGMFDGAINFNQDLSGWNVGKVTNMEAMFRNTLGFNQDIANWDVSKVTSMVSMFEGSMDFNQDLGAWNVGQVKDMTNMFANNALNTDFYDSMLNAWAELPVLQQNVVFDGGFSKYCDSELAKRKLKIRANWTIKDEGKDITNCNDKPFITTWKTDNPGTSADDQITIPTASNLTYNYQVDWGDGTSTSNIAGNITHTYAIPGTYTVSITGDFPWIYFGNGGDAEKLIQINQWGDIKWKNFNSSFSGCSNVDVLALDVPDLSQINATQSMFFSCRSLVGNSNFNYWDMSNVRYINSMFGYAEKFNQDLTYWDVSNVLDMSSLFTGATSFNQKIENWDVGMVNDMTGMFAVSNFNQPLGNWNVSNVQNMGGMFNGNKVFNQDISAWDVSSVTSMSSMFQNTELFNQDISTWDTSNVQNMLNMFNTAIGFNQDISTWDVGNITDMGGMFQRASSFNQDISNWNVSNVTNMMWMFNEATDFDQSLGNWDVQKVRNMSLMFDGIALSIDKYNSTLIGWSQLPALLIGVTFNAGNSKFCEGGEARQFIIDTFGWNIQDGGEVPLCNEDNDVDGVFDHLDSCLNTNIGVPINENGCEIISVEAISVYTKTPSCPGVANGSIEISSNLLGYSLDISIAGDNLKEEFMGVTSDSNFSIPNLSAGSYTVTVSIPNANYEQNYGISINEIDDVSGKRQVIDTKNKTVTYLVSGSKLYSVEVNGELRKYSYPDTGTHELVIRDLKGSNSVVISGDSDCQGKVSDSFFMDQELYVYPTLTSEKVFVDGAYEKIEVAVYDLSGRMLFKKNILKGNDKSVDLSSNEAGLYSIKVTKQGKTTTFKIIKK